MIIACINAYQDERFIKNAIISVLDKVDRIIVVDGVYEGFELYNFKPYSTDRTVIIAENLGCEIIETRWGWKDQVEKRNAYLVGGDGDWYFMIDADERLHGELKPGEEDSYRIQCQFRKSLIPLLRLFKHQEGIKYIGGHNIISVNDKIILENESPVLKDCWIEHFTDLRGEDRQRRKNQYYGYQYQIEREFREENGLP